MAKKDIDLDDFDLNDDFDIELDFDPPPQAIPEGREALTEAPKVALKSAALSLAGPGKRRRLILDSLPDDYSVAHDAGMEIVQEGREVYQEARRQLTETKRELKRAVREASPTLRRWLPESLQKKVDAFARDDSVTGSYDEGDPRESSLQAMLSDTFTAQQEYQEQKRVEDAEDRIEDDIKDRADAIRQDQLGAIVTGIRGDTAKMAGYIQVTDKYRRKMLEVNWRQYYALTDLVQTVQTSMERLIPNSDAIVKNTALPDYAKEEFSEIGAALMKREIINNLGPGQFAREFISKLGDNTKRAIADFGSSVRDNISMVGSAAAMMEDNMGGGMGEQQNLSPAQQRAQMALTGAELAGATFAQKVLNPRIQKLQAKIKEHVSNDPNGARVGRDIAYFLQTIPELLNDIARNPGADNVSPLLDGMFGDFLSSVLPTYMGDRASIGETSAESLAKPAPWTERNNVTLNEIIPGWLAKINQSIRRLGGEDAPREQFDMVTRQYVTEEEIHNRITKRVEDAETREYIRNEIDNLVKEIVGERDVSEDAKEALGKILDEKIRTVSRFNVKDMAESWDTYGSHLNEKGSEEVRDLFGELDIDEIEASKINKRVSDEMRRIRDVVEPIQDAVDELMAFYGKTAVANSGIFDRDGTELRLNTNLTSSYGKFEHGSPKEQQEQIRRVVTEVGNVAREKEAVGITFEDLAGGVGAGVSDALFGQKEPNLYSVLAKISREPTTEQSANQLDEIVSKIYDQLVENNLTPQVDAILALVEDMALRGINILGESDSEGVEGVRRERPGYFGKFGQHVSSGAGKAYNFAKRTTTRIVDGVKRIVPSPKSVITGITGAFSGAKTFVTNTWNSARGAIADIRDADGNIVLEGRLLKAGKYYNALGERIKSIKDIVGAVYDENGVVVLTEEEVRTKKDQFTYYTEKGWKKLAEGMGRLVGGVTNTVLGVPKVVIDKITTAAKWGWRKVTTSADIYVEGEPEPRLRKHLMEKGFYVQMETGKPIRSVNDIDGPVITKYKEMIISSSDLANPDFKLVDVDGKPFETVMQKIGSKFRSGVDVAIKAGTWVKDKFTGLVGGVADMFGAGFDWVKGLFNINGFDKKTGGHIVDRLDLIYKLLDERLPGGTAGDGIRPADQTPDEPEQRADDADGDGVRDNSFMDNIRKRREAWAQKRADKAAAKKERQKTKGEQKASDGFLSWMMGGLGGLKSMFTGLGGVLATSFAGKALSMFSDGFGSIFSRLNPFGGGDKPDVPDAPGKPGAKPGAKPGILRRLGGALWTGTKVVGKGVGYLGLGALKTIGWAGMGALNVGAAIGTGAAAVITSPITMGLAAAAGTVALGYGAYKLATMKNTGRLTRLRLAQYGTEDFVDAKSDEVKLLINLESELLKNVTYDNAGVATLKGVDNKRAMEIAQAFGIDVNVPENVKQFELWLYGRYIPIFLLWASRARQVAPTAGLDQLDDNSVVSYAKQLEILNGVSLRPDHPVFKVMVSPFGSRGVLDTVGGWFGGDDMMSGEAVKEVEETVKIELTRLAKEEAAKAKDSGKSVNTAAAAGDADNQWYKLDESHVVKRDDGKVEIGGKVFRDMKTYKTVRDTYRKRDQMKTNAGNAKQTQSVANEGTLRNPSDTNAVEAVRLRAYGLRELQVDKVKLLWELEEATLKHVSIAGATATSMADPEKMAEQFIHRFGLHFDRPEELARWMGWYTSRFLPVFLRYLSALRQHATTANPLMAVVSKDTPYMLDVANAIVSTRSIQSGQEVTVWFVTESPFSDIPRLNDDASSVSGNLDYLRNIAKRAKASEQNADDSEIELTHTESQTKKDKKPEENRGTAMSRSILARVAAQNESSGGTSGQYSNVNSDKMPVVDEIPIGESTEAADPDGQYAKLRLEGKSKDAVAKLIKEVSKATGMDQNLMLTVAMMESSLNPDAGAGTSSAKGLYQFIDGTWKYVVDKYANKYGIPANASPYDPVANALLGAEYLREGAKGLKSVIPNGEKVGPVEMYLAHFLGHGGARKFLKKLYSEPDRIAAQDFMGPAKSNAGIFKTNGNWLSYRDIYSKLAGKARARFQYVAKYSDNPTAEPTAEPTASPTATASTTKPGGSTPTSVASVDDTPTSASAGVPEGAVASTGNAEVVKNDDGTVTAGGRTYRDMKTYRAVQKARSSADGMRARSALNDVNNDDKLTETISPERREVIEQRKAAQSTEMAVNEAIATTAAPTSVVEAKAQSSTNVTKAVKRSVESMEKAEPTFDPRAYEKQARATAQREIARRNDGEVRAQKAEVDGNVAHNQRVAEVMSKQLTTLVSIDLHLRHIKERMSFDGTPREKQQLERDQQREVQKAPVIEHGDVPISVSRVRR